LAAAAPGDVAPGVVAGPVPGAGEAVVLVRVQELTTRMPLTNNIARAAAMIASSLWICRFGLSFQVQRGNYCPS
jgi:hypothetical protein